MGTVWCLAVPGHREVSQTQHFDVYWLPQGRPSIRETDCSGYGKSKLMIEGSKAFHGCAVDEHSANDDWPAVLENAVCGP
jgi:hypothetical protein